ncbi:MAG: DUF350 domain-containing protein [Stackebrandtia sp.]
MDTDTLTDFLDESIALLAYSGVGVVLMALGVVLVELLTPGNLRKLIWEDRNRNAALLLASNLIAVGLVAAMAVYTTEGDAGLAVAVASSFIYGLISLIVMGVAFVLLDFMTPGKLGELVTRSESHPAVYVSMAMHLAIALVIVAGLS